MKIIESNPLRGSDPAGTPPLVSICSLAYNHAPFVARALDSFLMQETTFPMEIIVHDDGSTDGTAQLIESYQSRHPGRITAILQSENQRSQGRHVLPLVLERATGRYIALCEADDYWTDPLKLQKQVDLLEAQERYVGCYHAVKAETHLESGEIQEEVIDGPGPELSVRELLCLNFIRTPSVVVRRNCLPVELPPRLRRCAMGDWPRWILAATHGPWAYLPEPMAVYVVHRGGVWSQLSRVDQEKRIIAMLAPMCAELPPTLLRFAHQGLLDHCHRLVTAGAEAPDDNAAQWIAGNLSEQHAAITADAWACFDRGVSTYLASALLSTGSGIDANKIIDRICAFLARIHGDVSGESFANAVRLDVSQACQNYGNEAFTRGNSRLARTCYRQSLAANPRNARVAAYYVLSLLGGSGSAARARLKSMLGRNRSGDLDPKSST